MNLNEKVKKTIEKLDVIEFELFFIQSQMFLKSKLGKKIESKIIQNQKNIQA